VKHAPDIQKPVKDVLIPVAVKIPAALLSRIDSAAAQLGLTRTAWLRMTAIQALPAPANED
jgi:hypothetical protein